MSAVIFHWSVPKGFDNPHVQKRLLSRWGLTCKAFGIHKLICVSDEKVSMNDSELEFAWVPSLLEALCKSDGEVIYVEEGGIILGSFYHPKEATYVFGSDYGELKAETKLSIPTSLPLHAEVAAGIILADRSMKCL